MHKKLINFRVTLFLSDINECEVYGCPSNLHYCENMKDGGYSCTMGKKRKPPSKIPIIGMSVCSLNLEIWKMNIEKNNNKVLVTRPGYAIA